MSNRTRDGDSERRVRATGEEARVFLDRLEEGYTIRFSRSGLVFDFDKPDTEPAKHEVGIEFHGIGSDLIRSLVQEATETRSQPSTPDDGDPTMEFFERQEHVLEEAAPPPRIPRLDRAVFLVADRDHSTTDLGTGSGVRANADAPKARNVPAAG